MQSITRVDYPNYRPARMGSAIGFALIFPVALSGIVSGGATGATYRAGTETSFEKPFVRVGTLVDGATKYAPNIVQDLLRIRDVFDLNMSEVARIFGVSRPAAYAWISGALPKPEIVQRIYRLSAEADNLSSEGFTRVGSLLYRPLDGGKTLLDVLQSGGDVKAAIASLRQIATREAATRKLSFSRHGVSKNTDTTATDEIATPVQLEHRS